MIDAILLFPYWLTLKIRHFLFDKGIRKSHPTKVPSICVGNITVGGTGKTPHTEMLLRMLLNDPDLKETDIAILSRGYGRKTKGFQQVEVNGSARDFGDEPLQIKRKFPQITVAVDGNRKEGCELLCEPRRLGMSKKYRNCVNKDVQKAGLIILDDAFQHRAIKPTASIVLMDSNRPIFKDHLLPLGRLRDLRGRIKDADIVIVTKCTSTLDFREKCKWAKSLGIKNFNEETCSGTRRNGKKQYLFFTRISYDTPAPVFAEGNQRYVYSKKLVLFSGIANDAPLKTYLNRNYEIVGHLNFPDHHKFSNANIRSIEAAAKENPTSVIMTTEKDCQRVRDCANISDNLKTRLFFVPIKTDFLSTQEREIFSGVIKSYLK